MTEHSPNRPSAGRTLFISAAIIAAAVAFTWVIFSTEPEAKREGATKRTAMLVETRPVEIGDFTPVIEAMGTVMASRDIELQAQVSGQVTAVSDQFVPGMVVRQGTLLMQLDPTDYEIEVAQRQSDLSRAQADLQIEMGEQMAAELDFKRLGRDVSAAQKSLILREPQLARAEAQVAVAQSLLDQARLNLERTRIVAPFDAQLQSIGANLGSQVNTGDSLADLVGIDTYWIEATLPVNQLAWIDSAAEDQLNTVTVQDRLAWPETATRNGSLMSVIGQVDQSTRMARVMISVDDPLAVQDTSLPSLTIGSFVACSIPARTLTNVARIDREYVRKNDTLWLMVDQQLQIRSLNVIYRDEEHVYVRDSLNAGDQMVTTELSRVAEGAELRLMSASDDER